jgi:coatomer subunit beta'
MVMLILTREVEQGKLRNGSTVVVKRLAVAVDDKKFLDCVHCLMSVKHNNIVRFLGYCANTNENVTKEGFKSVSEMARGRLLCFEDICNGNLQMHLTGMYGDGIQLIPFLFSLS